MYVCLCHGFTDRQVRSAINEGGAGTTAEVYKKLACQPRCGKCVPVVRDMVGKAKEEGGCGGGKCGCAG